jgi:signal transduction histidine kinase/ligand-binding sensor domain-containing protein
MILSGIQQAAVSTNNGHIWRLLLCLLLFPALNSLWAVDPSKHISQYAHTSWRRQEGIFNGTPSSITQTTDGYMWIGTQAGLVRFDGVRFVRWNPPDGNQLPSTAITSLLGTRDGSLWIGTKTGLSRWKNKILLNYLPGGGVIDSIIEDRRGTIWVAQQRIYDEVGPLCRVIEDEKMHCYEKAGGIPLSRCCLGALMEDPQEGFWIGDDTRIIRWKESSSSTYSPTGLKPNMGQFGVNAFAASADGSLWAGIFSRGPDVGLQHLERGVWKRFVTPELDSSTLGVSRLLVDRQDSLWIGTAGQGLYRIQGSRVDHFDTSDGLSNDFVTALYEDREGDLWVSTMKGVDNFRDIQVATFSKREGLGLGGVDSVLASRDGTVWAGGETLNILRRGSVTSLQVGNGLPGNQVTAMFEDHAGRLWIGIDNAVTIYRGGKFRRINQRDGSPIGLVTGMTEDVENNIWVETKGPPRTLFRIQDFKVLEDFPAPGMPAARRVVADPQGGIWLGLMSGDLARYRRGKLDIFAFPHGSDPFVSELLVNPDGSVLGATESGLIGWRNGKQQTLTNRNGLPCNNIFTLASDKGAALWLYTECGLIKITNTELQKWWESPQVRVQFRNFDVSDGALPAWVAFGGVTRAPDGRLWFANQSTLQMIDPAHLNENTLPPPVHVEEIIANQKRYPPQEGLHLPALIRDLEIDYTALSFVAPQKVLFRYKLEGHDLDWEQAGTRRQAFYSDLRPGEYRFHVIACNNDGLWNDVGATMDFSIAPEWYQTLWFLILCAMIGILTLWVLHLLRLRQVSNAISARFDERLAERTRLAREFHDTLLQTIQGSKMVADDALDQPSDPDRMRRAMERLSEWLGQSMGELRTALNSLRTSTTQGNDLAESLRRASEDCLVKGRMKVMLSVTGPVQEMHPIVRDEVYRIGYEAIRNADIHSGASQLEIELGYSQDLIMRVRDNGIGIDHLVAEQGKEGHFGLQGMRERAVRIGATLSLVSSTSSGTEITLIVPGGIIFRKSKGSPTEHFTDSDTSP